jgi:phosphoribosylglycinamide formyltransferase-1
MLRPVKADGKTEATGWNDLNALLNILKKHTILTKSEEEYLFRPMPRRIVVLSDKGPASYYLINRLLADDIMVGVVFEKRPFKSLLNVLKARVKRIGFWGVINQILLGLYTRLIEKPKDMKTVSKIFNDQPTENIIKDVDKLEVKSINHASVKDFVVSKSPDLVVVNGTTILKAPLIELFPQRIINVHVGITPEYRGTHGGFWALYNGEKEMAGVTVHLIDKGIDSGDILYQEKVTVAPEDTLRGIVLKQQKVGIDLVFKCLEDFNRGKLNSYRKPDSHSKLYYSPGLTHYLKYISMKRKKKGNK